MLQKLIVHAVIWAAVTALNGFTAGVDWASIKAAWEAKVESYLPSWLAALGDGVVDKVLDAVQSVLGSTDALSAVLTFLGTGDFAGAVAYVKSLLVSVVSAEAAKAECDHDELLAVHFSKAA